MKRKRYTPAFKAQVVLEILKEEKSMSQLASEHGIHVNQLSQWKNQALEQLPNLFDNHTKGVDKLKKEQDEEREALYAEVGKLTTQLSWLKKNLASKTREERVELIDWHDPDLTITEQANLLSINRTSLYYKPVQPSLEDVQIKHRIDKIYTKYPFYGSRRMTVHLNKRGIEINRKAVQRHMREMGIAGISPGPNLSKRRLTHHTYPYLLRGLAITRPNQVWAIDITYIRMKQNWMYLVAVIDWYSRYVISWELDQVLEMSFVLHAVEKALEKTTPEIMNSDQGSHFTSTSYTDLLKEREVNISMDGKGRALDNIIIERLWRNVKYEDIYLKEYTTPRSVRKGVRDYFIFYNEERPHQSLEDRPPAEIYLP
ncbi:IS3 family transposase [Alteribacillus sp. YIM 98480]|uniref:IS3 family transposase n=1 Tax=Alteribacillus sp. YIM 98480 TaxID=2606599 RepID=UPI00131BA734|nr:IS3 family transposase [Alteribacillus sp. YIM 98480]